MRLLPILSIACLTAATPALAQVTVDLHALEALPQRPATHQPQRRAPAAAAIRPAPSAQPSPSAQATPSTQETPSALATPGAQATPSAQATPGAQSGTPPSATTTATGEMPVRVVPPAPAPAIPETVPQTASIEPVAPPPPAAGAAPPPPPPVSATAGTVAAPTSAGLRLTFAPGQSDLTPESVAAIKKLTSQVTLGDATTYNVSAYAPGKPDDPSTARRLSLSRAMAVRSALVADGVPSPRIFVRALGAEYGNGPADRVDLDVTGAATAAATPEAPSK
ncbi:MAG: hypothetical protein B7Z80_27410 [Rhodospirillales bacterium 20-64-7]|nr:MAG: hypothetical protein B7Z80_27410 [Rhodospirillales bacterium 20-64-7]HQT77539.1 OmpA family protein [Rhodopila sp.]